MSKEFLIPSRIITGENAIQSSIKYLSKMGKKALIVTGKTVVTLESFKLLTYLLDDSDIKYSVFTGITGEPTDLMINEGLKVYRENKCDFLIGIGGGSPIDSMKAIAVLDALGGDISDYIGKEICGDLPPMAAFPTTAGTGSEATKFTVITDTKKNIKMLLSGESLIPDLAVVDFSLTFTSPKSITASTGLDALTHAVESYTSKKAQPLTDAVSISAIKRIFRYLTVAYENGEDVKARYEMSIAALEAGIAINNASVTIVHGMSRPIGALFHIPHGMSNAMLLEKCMSFALDGAIDRFADLGRATGKADNSDDDITAGKKFVDALGEICRKCNVPTLAQYGVDKDEFFSAIDKMSSDAAASGSPSNTRKDVTVEDMRKIYRELW